MIGDFSDLLRGFTAALQPAALAACAVGVTLGTAVGVLPGIGPALTIALLLPVTYDFAPSTAFIMFAGIYAGAMYGGSTASILVNAPGESASMMSALEGHEMTKRGRGGTALATAALGSFVAGTLGVVTLTLTGPQIARLGTVLQPADYCTLIAVGLLGVTAVLGNSWLRGLTSLCLGLGIGLVGIDRLSGSTRLTFGRAELLDGIDVVLVAVGVLAVGEVLYTAFLPSGTVAAAPTARLPRMTGDDWRRSWKPWLRGFAIGFPIGSLPAGGAELATVASYTVERQLSAHPEEFGRGAVEGVAGPEAANNAAFCGVLVPLLTLGLPTSATAAVLLAAFHRYDIQPGPALFEESGALLWAMIASLYVGNVMLLVLNLPLIGIWVRLLSVPPPLLGSCVLVFATLGIYSRANRVSDVLLLYALGGLGFWMRRWDVPTAPLIMGVILGPMLEAQLRRALAFAGGDPAAVLSRPLPLLFVVVTAVLMAAGARRRWTREIRSKQSRGIEHDRWSPTSAWRSDRDQ